MSNAQQPYGAESGTAAPRDFPSVLVWLGWLVWLPFLIQVVIGFLQEHTTPPRLVIILSLVASFLAIYLWTTWHAAYALKYTSVGPWEASPSFPRAVLPLVVLTLLSFVVVRLDGPAWGGLFFYTAATTAACLPFGRAMLATGLLTCLVVGGGWLAGVPTPDLTQALFLIPVIGFNANGAMWAVKTNRELRVAREELARLAVSEERLRFARDLHDLLGHTLSLITLKSELAGRLVPVSPERAIEEIGDVEAAARKALQEVREAVAGYRQATLASELHAAREILTAAGIELTQHGEISPLSAPAEAALSWAVREGVTNVIRHSRARHCSITVAQRPDGVTCEVINDGRGIELGGATAMSAAPGAPHTGSGLRGLAERVAGLGGTCMYGPDGDDGYRLTVSLPTAAQLAPLPLDGRAQPVRKGA